MSRRRANRQSSGEEVDVVDEHDSVIGSSSIGECLAEGLLHRAVAVLVVRSTGRFLLQRRSRKDRWHPGLLTISSTGHVKKGESYDAAAARELHEELGLEARLEVVGKYLLPAFSSRGLTEREWVTFYEAHSDSGCRIDPVEVDSVEEVDEARVRRMFEGHSMTPDAVILLAEYLRTRSRRE